MSGSSGSPTFIALLISNLEVHGLRWTVQHLHKQVKQGKLSKFEFRFFLARAVEQAKEIAAS